MKKIISCFLLLCLTLCLSTSVTAQSTYLYVDDQADILTAQEEADLSKLAQIASHQVDCGIYVLTVENFKDLDCASEYSVSSTLSAYFKERGYGFGPDRDGVILMLSMAERDYSLFTNGFGDTGLSDPAMDYLLTTFLSDFGDNEWYNGFEDYINCTEKLLQKTIDGHPFNENTPTPGEKITGAVISVLLAVLVSHLITDYFVRQMKSVALKTSAGEFGENLVLSHRDDRYTHTTTSRVYDPPSSSSSSHSSGGHSSGCSRSGKF